MWSAEAGLLRVGLGARSLVLARGPVRGADCRTVALEDGGSDRPWQAGLQALEAALARWPGSERPKRMVVVLANELLRWQLVEMPLQAVTDEEQQALLRQHFLSVYGPRSAAWVLRRSGLPAGQAQPVCAVDPELLAGLTALAVTHRVRLTSVAPYLSRAHDHWRRRMRAPSYWLAQTEPGALTLALVLQGRWRALRCQRLGSIDLHALPSQLAQLGLGTGWAGETLPLYLIHSGTQVQPARPELPLTVLEPEAPALRTVPHARLAWGL